MGQYYQVALKQNDKISYYNLQVAGEAHNGWKLMEHSWWLNPFCLALSEKMYKKPSRVVWYGDYCEPEDFDEFPDEYKKELISALEELIKKNAGKGIKKTDFSLNGKFLVNYDEKCYVDLSEYYRTNEKDGWCVFPISLLTAVGNGRGGGDYRGVNEDYCGMWTWNLLSIEDKAPEGFEKIELEFYEE